MEENNKLETTVDNSGSGSMLYGAEPRQQVPEDGHSSVYGGASPVQLTKPSDQGAEPAQQSGASVPPQGAVVPVHLTKPSEQAVPVQQPGTSVPPCGAMPVQQPGTPIPPQGAMPMQQPEAPVPPPSWQPSPMPQGQPGQNPMGFGPMQVPPPVQGAPSGKRRKNGAGIIVGILCVAAVAIFIVIGVLAVRPLFGDNPQKQLAKGFANMTKEMAAYQSSVADDIGLDALSKLKETAPIHTNMDFSFTDPNETGSINHFNVEIDGITDYGKKMAEYGLGVGAYGFSMNIGSIVAAENTLYLRVPMVLQDDVYSLDLTHLGKDFNHSAWSDLSGETLPEDYSLTLFENLKAEDGAGMDTELHKIFERQGHANEDAMKYETIKQKKEFTFEGTAAAYGGVRVTIDKDVYNSSLEAMRDDILDSDFYDEFMQGYQMSYIGDFAEFKKEMDHAVEQMFGVRLEQDFVLDFYLDGKGRIVNISTPEDIAVSCQDTEMEFMAVDIDFAGSERTLDSIEGGIYVKAGDEILYMSISRTASITEEYYSENLTLRMQENNSDDEITFWYANQWGYTDQTFDLKIALDAPDSSLGFTADGSFTDIEKGERFTFLLDHGAVTIDGEDLLLLTGSIGVEPAEDEIEVPADSINVLDMSESDIEDLLYGILY